MTALFFSVILNAKYLNGAKDLFMNALVIGLTLFLVICTGGSVSGGVYNPALGLIQTLSQSYITNQSLNSSNKLIPLYTFAPLLGGILSGFFKHLSF